MKKLLALTLATMMTMTIFTGCSSDSSSTTTNDQSSTTTNTDTDIDTSNDDTDEEIVSELAKIQEDGVMNIGYTLYAPMNYEDDNGDLTGFDTEFTLAVCEKLGVEANFIIINWDTKVFDLEAGYIDAIWNGMTITDELLQNISISDPYVQNKQVVVISTENADKYTDTQSLIEATIVAEAGSAGEVAINTNEDLSQATYLALTKQTDALLEVKSGSADAAVFDWTLAKSVVGEGTDFEDLMMIDGLSLSEENYGIGFRKDSDLVDAVNDAIKELIEDGTLPSIAEKYDLGLAQ